MNLEEIAIIVLGVLVCAAAAFGLYRLVRRAARDGLHDAEVQRDASRR